MKNKAAEKNGISHWRLGLVCVLLFLTTLCTGINGQSSRTLLGANSQFPKHSYKSWPLFFISNGAISSASQEAAKVGRQLPIPKDSYKSWCLFLVNNPDWLVSKNEERLKALYEAFHVFGDAIGPSHLAVWFGTDDKKPVDPSVVDVDVNRSAAFCEKLKLLPSKSPYVLVTTTYPGAALINDPRSFPSDLKNFSVLAFGGADASEITRALTDLADQLVVNGVPKTNPESEGFWRSLQKSFEVARSNIVGFGKSFTLTIKTSWFEANIKPQ